MIRQGCISRKALASGARSISSTGQQSPRVHDCVVVGGGISGLTTAFRLAEVLSNAITQRMIAQRMICRAYVRACSVEVMLLSPRRIPVSAETLRPGGKGSTRGERG
jgi:hypothetical protein